jgi:hypothetical protein
MGNTINPEKQRALIDRFNQFDRIILEKAKHRNSDLINDLLDKSKDSISCLGTEYSTNQYILHLMIYKNFKWTLCKSYTCKY